MPGGGSFCNRLSSRVRRARIGGGRFPPAFALDAIGGADDLMIGCAASGQQRQRRQQVMGSSDARASCAVKFTSTLATVYVV